MKTQTLVERSAREIKGVIECFDRVVLFGTYKTSGWPGAMEEHLRGRGTTFLEFNQSDANALRLEMAGHVRELARAEGLEVRQVHAGERTEAIVEQILAVHLDDRRAHTRERHARCEITASLSAVRYLSDDELIEHLNAAGYGVAITQNGGHERVLLVPQVVRIVPSRR